VGYSFVDDMDIVQSNPEEQDHMVTARRMKGTLDTCDGGIGDTCGTSEPATSFCYLLSFIWEHGCWSRYATISETLMNVLVLDVNGRRVILERLEAHESHNSLRV
jgi:hypothetical protein